MSRASSTIRTCGLASSLCIVSIPNPRCSFARRCANPELSRSVAIAGAAAHLCDQFTGVRTKFRDGTEVITPRHGEHHEEMTSMTKTVRYGLLLGAALAVCTGVAIAQM